MNNGKPSLIEVFCQALAKQRGGFASAQDAAIEAIAAHVRQESADKLSASEARAEKAEAAGKAVVKEYFSPAPIQSRIEYAMHELRAVLKKGGE